MKYIVSFLLTASFVLIGGAAQANPYDAPVHTFKNGSVKLEKAERKVKVKKVVYAERVSPGHTYIELNTGATLDLVDCEVEDGRNCYWDAKSIYNKIGHSFADVRGTAIYLKKGLH